MAAKLKNLSLMTLGTLLIVVGIYFFKFPNHFTTGGVSGSSVILGSIFTSFTPGAYVLIINMLLMFVGFIFVGKDFGVKTVYCVVLQSVLTYALEFIYPMKSPLTNEPLLELVIAIFLTTAGSAILFNMDASTGGTDIIAMIIKKYTGANISVGLFLADCAIVLAAWFVFDIEVWLLSMVGFLAKVLFVNTLLETINLSKCCTVIVNPQYEEAVTEFITTVLKRSATISRSYKGAYNDDDKSVFILVLGRSQTLALKRFVKGLDSKAFIIITNAVDICGKGFREAV